MIENFGIVSFHLQKERAERVYMIETCIGWGETMLEVHDYKKEHTTTILTTTGVVVIKDSYTEKIITAYVPSPSHLISIFMKAGKTSVPNEFFTTTRRAYQILNELGL